MILTDIEITKAIQKKQIVIDPYNEKDLGSNSYDVHLSENLACYKDSVLDAKKNNEITHFKIPKEGFVLHPGILYLGVIQEYNESHVDVPFLEGKSSVGRLGIDIHATAGKGDVGYKGHWTLELSVTQPVRVYTGMPIGQLIFFKTFGKVKVPYDKKASAKYNNKNEKPIGSKMYKNRF